jgi:uncharacterized protein YbbC (DUF1343 family)/CubicO group peptidase (beta-lactamase class C family)
MKSLRQVTLLTSILALALCSFAAPAVARKKHKARPKPKPLVFKEMGNFTAVDALVQQQISAEAITGAVLVVGHDGHIVHQKAFGLRAVTPRREPMTLDTIFDLASLTKVVATTPSVMRLLQYGQIRLEEPFSRHISEFGANGKENVTIRQMLTHYSGLRPDLELNPPWEGQEAAFRLAHEEKLQAPPGAQFVYSDINFLELGELVQQASGMSLDKYAEVHIFGPLGMKHTMFRPSGAVKSKIAETLSVDNKHVLRGLVQDPTAERMGGVAGHAGLFSTAGDLALYAQALIDRQGILAADIIEKMTTPQQPPNAVEVRGLGWDIDSPFSSNRGALLPVGSFGHTGFTGTSLWIDPHTNTYIILLTNSVHPRLASGPVVALRSHVATAVAATLELDVSSPAKEGQLAITGYSELAAASRHVSSRNGHVLTGIDVLEKENFASLRVNAAKSQPVKTEPVRAESPKVDAMNNDAAKPDSANDDAAKSDAAKPDSANDDAAKSDAAKPDAATAETPKPDSARTDSAVTPPAQTDQPVMKIGILTNQTGLDAQGNRTIDVLSAAPGVKLTAIFSPEHGLFGNIDTMKFDNPTDSVTGIQVHTLYGNSEAKRRPSVEELKKLDAVIFDIQDVGTRYYTYPATLGYLLEAAAAAGTQVIVLDRPNPVTGSIVQGPMSSDDHLSFTNYRPIPIRHGMTMGELALMYNEEYKIGAKLKVIPMQGWLRGDWFDATGIVWTNTSPNLRSVTEAALYPAVGIIESTNVSVGRGTDTPFEVVGAPWIKSRAFAEALNARMIAGVRFVPVTFTPNSGPYAGQPCGGVNILLTDRSVLDAPEMGIELAATLHKLHPDDWKMERLINIVANQDIVDAVARGDDPRAVAQSWQDELQKFKEVRAKYLLYR